VDLGTVALVLAILNALVGLGALAVLWGRVLERLDGLGSRVDERDNAIEAEGRRNGERVANLEGALGRLESFGVGLEGIAQRLDRIENLLDRHWRPAKGGGL
jgi:hypothetical protein